jgi:hypothetical protein
LPGEPKDSRSKREKSPKNQRCHFDEGSEEKSPKNQRCHFDERSEEKSPKNQRCHFDERSEEKSPESNTRILSRRSLPPVEMTEIEGCKNKRAASRLPHP